MIEVILFALMGAGAIAGAVTVVMARNPVYAAMGLLATMFSLAVLYLVQLAHLVAAIQIIVYAGAVMTLFLFVIMLIGVDKTEDTSETLPRQRLMVAVLGAVAVATIGFLTVSGRLDWVAAAGVTEPSLTNGTVQAIAERLFETWLLPLEVTALLLTVAAAAAIALGQYRRRQT